MKIKLHKITVYGITCPYCKHEFVPRKGGVPEVCPNPKCHRVLAKKVRV